MSADMKMNTIGGIKFKRIVDGFIDTVAFFRYLRVTAAQPGMVQAFVGQDSEIKRVRVHQRCDFMVNPKGDPQIVGANMAGQLGMISGMT